MAAPTAVGVRFWVTSSFKISNFGMNPVRGGRPAVDRSRSANRVVVVGDVDQEVVMFCSVFVEVSSIIRIVGIIVMMYVKMLIIDAFGCKARIITVQPMFVIDE